MLYIDVTRLYHNNRLAKTLTGVDKVGLAYIREFGSVACAVLRLPSHWLFFPKARSDQLFHQLLNNIPVSIGYVEKRRYIKPYHLERNFLLNTAHSGLEKTDYIKTMTEYNLQGIYFLHDLIPIDYPEYCRVGEDEKHRQRLLTMATGQLVIANSYYTWQRWQIFCQQYALQSPESVWAHLGVDWDLATMPTKMSNALLELVLRDKPYFLILGTIEGRKNHLFLLNLWRVLIEKFGEDCPKLVIAGKRGWECEQVIDILDRSPTLKQAVIELNYCDDTQVAYLIQNAVALLFPSHIEGFGLPLVEACAYGKPILANDIAVFRELGFNNLKCITTLDGIAWQNEIETLWANYAKTLMLPYKSSPKLPTWQQHFAVVRPKIDKLIA